MKHEYISPSNKMMQTPLRLLIKQFPDLASQVFDKCMETNLQTSAIDSSSSASGSGGGSKQRITVSADDPQFRITFNYELLDDAYTYIKVIIGFKVSRKSVQIFSSYFLIMKYRPLVLK